MCNAQLSNIFRLVTQRVEQQDCKYCYLLAQGILKEYFKRAMSRFTLQAHFMVKYCIQCINSLSLSFTYLFNNDNFICKKNAFTCYVLK